MDEEIDDDNMTPEGDEGGQPSSSSEGKKNPSKVKSVKDGARRFGKSAQNFGEKLGKVVQALMKSKGKIIVGVIAVVVIIFLAMFWVAAEEEETQQSVDTIEEVVNSGTATANFSTFYQKTGSLLMATDADIDEIYDKYIEEIEKTNKAKAKAFKKKYFNGDPGNKTDLNDLKSFYKHVLNAEKYNFNRVEWRAFKRSDLVSGGAPTDKIDMQTDSDTGLKYPKYEGTLYASSELEYYTNALYRYMQSWIIPLAMTTGTTAGGLTATSPEGEAGDADDAYNTRFGYEIMVSGYHKLKYDRFEVYTRTKRDMYKEYDEGITSGTVDRVCTTYSIGIKDDGTYVYPTSADATSIQTSSPICVDSSINYGTENVTPIVEFPTSMSSSEYNIQKYYEDNKMNAANPATVKTNSSLKSEDLGDKADYQYDVTSYEGFDFKIEKEYTFTPYDLTKEQNLATESSTPFTTEEVYQGTSTSGTKYTPKNDTAPSWASSIYAAEKKTTTKVNVTKKTQNGATYTVEREWADDIELSDVPGNTYELTDLETFVGDTVSSIEKIYYEDIIADDGTLNIIDLINAKPDIYEKYLEKDQNISKYLGYSRDYLELSYYLLEKYMIKLAEEYKTNFMWGNTVVPAATMMAYGSGGIGETLLVTNANVIYPFSNADIGKTLLQDNYVTTIGGRGVYGYNSKKFGPHTGIDISLAGGSASGDLTNCKDYSNASSCPYVKGPKVYTIMEGTLSSVTYSECNTNYSTGHCSNDSYIQGLKSKANPNLKIKTSTGATSVTITEKDGSLTIYYHLYPDFEFFNELSNHIGETLPIGTFVGYMGNTGKSSGAHLHMENGTKLWELNGDRTIALLKQGKANTESGNISQVVTPEINNGGTSTTTTISKGNYTWHNLPAGLDPTTPPSGDVVVSTKSMKATIYGLFGDTGDACSGGADDYTDAEGTYKYCTDQEGSSYMISPTFLEAVPLGIIPRVVAAHKYSKNSYEIPEGTLIYIKSNKEGIEDYGYAMVGDTGGWVNEGQLDLYMPAVHDGKDYSKFNYGLGAKQYWNLTKKGDITVYVTKYKIDRNSPIYMTKN